VFNARYLIYVDDALTDYLEERGLAFQNHQEEGYLMVVVHADIDFRSEAVLGETLATTIDVAGIGRTSIDFGFEITEVGSDRPVANGKEVYVTVDRDRHRPIPVPDELRSRLI
jgi:acyl-CoA thioester hydrolase